MPRDDDFLIMLRATFKVEADEHLQAIAEGLLQLEKSPSPEIQKQTVQAIFRAAHSLKGAARAVNFSEIESICQTMEDAFAGWKHQQGTLSSEELDDLHRDLDTMTGLLASPAETSGGSTAPSTTPSLPIAAPPAPAPRSASPPVSGTPPPARQEIASPPEKFVAGETVRIAVSKLDARLLEAEEMLAAKLATRQRAADLRELAGSFAVWTKAWGTLEPEMRSLRQACEFRDPGAFSPAGLRRALDFFDWNQDYLQALEGKVAALARTAEQDRLAIGKLVDDLLEDSKKLLMLPLATQSAFFQKLVRDLCRDQGKEADLIIRGEEVEIDKRILEEMKDPLIHILRNCIDHGLETPEVRRRAGKPARAVITLAVSPINGSKVELLVADDGRGIDPRQVRESAMKHGQVTAEEAGRLSDTEALDLIFRSEVSTSPIITQLSGRGLGLAIVREKAEKLRGRVTVESRLSEGTVLRIIVPITLATFRGILVEAADRLFVIPLTNVERVARFSPGDIRTVEGRETLSSNGRVISLVRLAGVLELPPVDRHVEEPLSTPLVILGTGDQRVAFAVDAVLDEQEVLVKHFSRPLSRIRNVAGATILGSGQIAVILNVSDLLKSVRKGLGSARPATRSDKAEVAGKSILIAEDSITSRMLLKGILESAGYRVKVAVDGAEAFTTLRAESFDLVVSDVEMPRLNGFDLTARIRADKKLAELPVILVTALESREHRERGIDVGANAYLIKSNFDQSNLLEAVRRLA